MVSSNKVFVVDDEQSVVESIRFILESEGYEVEAFTDPRDMLTRGRKPVAGCLVTDVRMPGMSGLDMRGWEGGTAAERNVAMCASSVKPERDNAMESPPARL